MENGKKYRNKVVWGWQRDAVDQKAMFQRQDDPFFDFKETIWFGPCDKENEHENPMFFWDCTRHLTRGKTDVAILTKQSSTNAQGPKSI